MYINIEKAKANIENLQREFGRVKEQVKEEILMDFLDQIADENRLRVSVNTDYKGLIGFLTDGIYKNRHNLVAEGRRSLKRASYRREFAEDILGFGEEKRNIYYGALNTGNCGIILYDIPYCLILKPGSTAHRMSFLKDNSFAYVMERADRRGVLVKNPEREPLNDIAIWNNVNILAAIKHIKTLASRQEAFSKRELNDLLCNEVNFIEAHIFGSFSIEDIEEIRLPNNFVTEMMFWQNFPDKTKLAPLEQMSLNSYEESIIKIKEHDIKITIR